jgi:hypothetical protein
MAARDLYCSDWFIKAREYVETLNVPWFILSAKYGLVRSRQRLRPYERTLANMTRAEQRAWATRVVRQLQRIVRRGDRVVLLAGWIYRRDLEPALRNLGARAEAPLKRLSFGEQKAWLQRRAERATRAPQGNPRSQSHARFR